MMVTTTASLQHQHSTFNQLRRQFFIVGFDLKSVVKILAKILGKRQSVPVQLQLITNQLLSPRNSHLKTCGRFEEKSLRLVSRQYNSVQNVHYSRQMNFSTQCRQYILKEISCFFNQFSILHSANQYFFLPTIYNKYNFFCAQKTACTIFTFT